MADLTRQELMLRLMIDHNIRSVSDYAEQIVADATGGVRVRNAGQKGHDVLSRRFGRIEVKFRQLPGDGRVEERVALSNAKADGFDYLAIVIFHADFSVKGAVLVPYSEAWQCVQRSRYSRISYAFGCQCPGSIDITEKVTIASRH